MLNFTLTVDDTDYDMIEEFGCYPKKFLVGEAEPKLYSVDIPYADGTLDYTEALGVGVKYKRRILTIPCKLICDNPQNAYTRISNLFAGNVCKCRLSTDESWYYQGRVRIGLYQSEGWQWIFDVSIIADPYKYQDIVVVTTSTGSSSVLATVTKKPVVPTITTTANISITKGGNVYQFLTGTSKNLGLVLTQGRNTLQITGSATVTISYADGSL